MGEFALIQDYFAQMRCARLGESVLGIGDDCALWAPAPGTELAISTDTLVCGRHFFPDVDPATLGHKALAVNLSDLAAMGATPRAFLLSLTLPDIDPTWLRSFCAGMDALACQAHCELVGGDTTAGPLAMSITVIGEIPAGSALRRDAAEPGDEVWISGPLGGAALALEYLKQGQPLLAAPVRAALELPRPRVSLGQALRHLARAAIDVSDGLLQDAGHICDRSRVGMRLDWSRIPKHQALAGISLAMQYECVLAGGDDYELLFCAAAENHSAITALGERLGLSLACIGEVRVGQAVQVHDARGHEILAQHAGFDHFASRVA